MAEKKKALLLRIPPDLWEECSSCNGRGRRLFGERNHDISIIRQRLDDVPVAGFFAAGEIGPIGYRSFLHGHTAALAMFRHPYSDRVR